MWNRLIVIWCLITYNSFAHSELYGVELKYGNLLVVTPTNCVLGEAMLFYPPQAFYFTESIHFHFYPSSEHSDLFSEHSQNWHSILLDELMRLSIAGELAYTEIDVAQGGIPRFLFLLNDINPIESQLAVFPKQATTHLEYAHPTGSDEGGAVTCSSSIAMPPSAPLSQVVGTLVDGRCIYHGCAVVFTGNKHVQNRAHHCSDDHIEETSKLDSCLESGAVQCPGCDHKFRSRGWFVMHIRENHPDLQLLIEEGSLSLLPY